jgi:hypothetical protein
MPAEPTVAIVIPIHRQPGLAAGALACALREAQAEGGIVILVNDGCPFAETQDLCLDFATAWPDRIEALHTANGGLSAARNRAIRHARARLPGLEAVFLLDADNRLKPGALRRGLAALRTSGADWIYPDPDMFGLPWHGDMAGPYSVLRHLAENVCDAGSLIHARVFAAGLAFDETLREGYEDWDFWLRCAASGLRGAHCADFGFRYRSRPESMVREADRARPRIVADLQRRHAALFAPAEVLRREQEEAPRFCIVHPDARRFDFTSLPGASSTGGRLAALEARFWHAACHPVQAHFPPFVVLLDQAVLLDLRHLRLTEWLFWRLETLLEDHAAAAVRVVAHGTHIACEMVAAPGDAAAQIVALRLSALRALVDDPAATPASALLRLAAPVRSAGAAPDPAALAALLRATSWRRAVDGAGAWRSRPLIPGEALYREVRRLLDARAPLARDARRELAVIAPAATPGLERLTPSGWTTRLILIGTDPAPAWPRCDALCLLSDPADMAGLLGLLAGCAAVISAAAAALPAMATLRRQGVLTALSLAAGDVSLAQAAAWEHVLELVLVTTPAQLAQGRARGIPAAKLVLAAPG